MAEKSFVWFSAGYVSPRSHAHAAFLTLALACTLPDPFKRPTRILLIFHLVYSSRLSWPSVCSSATNHTMSSHHSNTSSPSEPSHSPQDPDPSGSKDDTKADGSARKRRKVTRSRAGCLTCRKRRKLCDMAKPDCGACERLRMVRETRSILNLILMAGMRVACGAEPRRGRAIIPATSASIDLSFDVVPCAATAVGSHVDGIATTPIQAGLVLQFLRGERYQPFFSCSTTTISTAPNRAVGR